MGKGAFEKVVLKHPKCDQQRSFPRKSDPSVSWHGCSDHFKELVTTGTSLQCVLLPIYMSVTIIVCPCNVTMLLIVHSL